MYSPGVSLAFVCLFSLLLPPILVSPSFVRQTGANTSDTPALSAAERFFAEQSYALAAESYRKHLLTAPLDGEARYRYAASLVRSRAWDEALTVTNALYSDGTLTEALRIKAAALRGELYRSLPGERWRVGEAIYWGYERPAVSPTGAQPTREPLREDSLVESLASLEEAMLRIGRLPEARRDELRAVEIEVCRELFRLLERQLTVWARDAKPFPPDTDWSIETTKPYPRTAPIVKRLFYVLTRRAELAESSPDEYLRVVMERGNVLYTLQNGFPTDVAKVVAAIPYAKEDRTALLIDAARRFPEAKNAADMFHGAARDTWLSERGKKLYAELLRLFPKYGGQKHIQEEIKQFEERHLFLGGTGALLADTKPITASQSVKNFDTVRYVLYRLDARKTLLDAHVWSQPGASPGSVVKNIGGWSRIKEVGVPVKSWQVAVRRDARYPYMAVEKRVTIPVPRDKTGRAIRGLYLITATAGNGRYRAAGVIPVTDMALVRKSVGKNKCLLYVANAETGKPVPGAKLSLKWTRTRFQQEEPVKPHREAVLLAKGETDQDGLHVVSVPTLPGDPTTGLQAVAQIGADRFAVLTDSLGDGYGGERWRGDSYDYREKLTAVTDVATYCYTERPLYRPNQTVFFRVIRAKAIGASSYRPKVGEQLTVRVVSNDKGKEIYKTTVTTSTFGTAHGSFVIPTGASLGGYILRASPVVAPAKKKDEEEFDDSFSAARFRVEEYRRSEFSVKLIVPRSARDGDTVSAKVIARRFDGSPLSGATVRFRIDRRYGATYQTGAPEPARTEEVFTDAQGEAAVAIPVAALPDPVAPPGGPQTDYLVTLARDSGTRYQISALVRDAAYREQNTVADVLVPRSWYTAQLSTPANFFISGGRATVNLAIRDGRDAPGNGIKGALVVRRLRFEPTGKTRRRVNRRGYEEGGEADTVPVYRTAATSEVIQKTDVRTGPDGRLQASFPAAVAGRYEVTFTGVGERNEAVNARATVLVGGGNGGDGSETVTPDRANEGADPALFSPVVGVRIVPERDGTYADGETARFLILAEKPDTNLLLCAETDTGLLYRQPVTVTGHSRVVSLTVRGATFAPNVAVSVMGVRDGDTVSASCNLPVPAVWNLARVSVTANKPTFQPGEMGTFRVRTTDASGKPVRAEVSLGAVDASLLALQGERHTYVGDFFYTNRERKIPVSLRGSEEIHFPTFAEYLDSSMMRIDLESGSVPPVPGALSGAGYDRLEFAGARLRTDFRETSVWLPTIVTDTVTGEAVVSATFPDSLTAWKVTAQGVTERVLVGAGNTEFVTRKNLAVRLSTPRFLVERDVATVTATVRNDLSQTKSVRVRLEGEGTIQGVGTQGTFPAQTITVPANGEVSVPFAVTVPKGSGTPTLRAYAETDQESDAVQATLPVLPYGAPKFETQAGSLAGGDGVATMRFSLPAERTSDGSGLLVQIAPGPVGAILDALPYLADFPYGCAEQTMSRFLPSVLVAKTLAKTGVQLDVLRKRAETLRNQKTMTAPMGQSGETTGYTYTAGTPDLLRLQSPRLSDDLPHGERWKNPVFDEVTLNEMTYEGLQRLDTFRKPDGGFAWWTDSPKSDPYMTAYILYGLAEMKSAGVKIPDGREDDERAPVRVESVLKTGAQYLTAVLDSVPGPDDRVWLLYTLACCEKPMPTPATKALDDAYANREKLSPYGLSLLALTLHRTGEEDKAKTLCRNLRNFIVTDAEANTAQVRWDGAPSWEWYANPNEASAWALRALLALEPESELLAPLAQGLLQRRQGGYWRSTKETAFIVYALTEYFGRAGQVPTNMTVTVALNDFVKREYRITPENALLMDNQFVVSGDLLKSGPQTVTVTKKGTGRLDFAGALQFVTTEDKIESAGKQIAVHRRYKRGDGSTLTGGESLKAGERVTVELTMTARNDHRYILLEDHKPAGCEPVNVRRGFVRGDDLWATCEVRDTKTAFFFDRFPRGTHRLTYELRAETPGLFHALPVNALAMYAPEVRATSGNDTVTVSP
jgi:uncharacterized protein YfaS (alpha-2-macroglobulin family)